MPVSASTRGHGRLATTSEAFGSSERARRLSTWSVPSRCRSSTSSTCERGTRDTSVASPRMLTWVA